MAKSTEELSRELIEKGEKLVAEANRALEESDRLYARHGLKRGDLGRMLDEIKNQLPPEDLARLEAEEAAFADEMKRDVELAMAEVRGTEKRLGRKMRRPRANTIKI